MRRPCRRPPPRRLAGGSWRCATGDGDDTSRQYAQANMMRDMRARARAGGRRRHALAATWRQRLRAYRFHAAQRAIRRLVRWGARPARAASFRFRRAERPRRAHATRTRRRVACRLCAGASRRAPRFYAFISLCFRQIGASATASSLPHYHASYTSPRPEGD